jgi:hypothetical protein
MGAIAFWANVATLVAFFLICAQALFYRLQCLVAGPTARTGAWTLTLIHAPDPAFGYPFPFGYITAARTIVDRFAYRIAELASKADGSKAILRNRSGEDAHGALAMIDQALGIGVA